jgi:Mn2+/Fe2+ NRAMP family transporter
MGGGSLSSSLYLGVLGGLAVLWVQPIAMILGIIMLSAIAYVTLSTEQRPLRAINEHINPVLGWGWILSAMTANLVWSMPQFALGTAALQQNLLPNVFGPDAMPDVWAKLVIIAVILAITVTVTMLYGIGGWGVKVFEIIVKLMVAMIVLCFFGVVVKMSTSGVLDWGSILKGFIPNPRLLFAPAKTLEPYIAAVQEPFRHFWRDTILSQQRQVMISATSAAVGINMTFLLPYSMLRKGWGRDFRGLATFDLSTGLFIPFILATGCIVIASASQFHTAAAPGFLGETDQRGELIEPAKNLVGRYHALAARRVEFELGEDAFSNLSEEQRQHHIESLPRADEQMAAILVERDAFDLAGALAPRTGRGFAQYVFGIGIFGMALGAITMLMLINGLCVCEMLNRPMRGWPQRIGSVMVAVGALGVFFWGKAKLWLAVPTSVFNITLLPIAYLTFYLLMNRRSLLGADVHTGLKRIVWNLVMAVACLVATFISVWTIWTKARWIGIAAGGAFVGLALIVQVLRPRRAKISLEQQ